MADGTFGELLRNQRMRAGMTQGQLATASGLSLETIRSYEQGRRMPDAAALERLRTSLSLANEDYDELRRAAGLRAAPAGFEATLKRARGAPETIWDEVQGTEWTTLILNERREIVAWNRLANRVGEIDLGSLSQFRRSILRMAATEHYDRHLTNWDELIGRLIAIFKVEGSDMTAGPPAQFVQAVLESIGHEDPRFLERIFSLFVSVEPWAEERRNYHPIAWRLDDGTDLRFHGAFADWSMYDGMWAFDWHAADAATANWVQSELAQPGGESDPPPAASFAETLVATRTAGRMSREKLADVSGIPAPTIRAYESGQRSPSRVAILALGRALNIDGYATNRFLRGAGFEEEPSDWARWMAGDQPIAGYKGRTALHHFGAAAIFRESDTLPWPSAVLDAGCHIVHVNPLAERLVGLGRFPALPGRPGPHLMQLMVSDMFMEGVRNWETVAGVILPGRLEPVVLGAERDASSNSLLRVTRQLLPKHARGIDQLADVWEHSPGFTSLRRPGVRFEWTTAEGDELTFNCVISGITASDPYKSLDLFPADAATFAWMGR